jgi:prevent-host-death family protein
MTTMGFYEARTHLSELLDQVAKGKKVLITRRGKPAALIAPPPPNCEG